MSEPALEAKPVPRWRAPLLMALKIAAVAVGIILLVRVLRRFNWNPVWDAVGQLVWWQIVLILAVVCVRQTVNAGTLPVLIRGLAMPQALVTSLSGTLIQTFSPPPSDTVLRLSILKSYGVETTRGAAGLVLDTVVFYLARFIAPVVALVLSIILLMTDVIHIWMAVLGIFVAAVLLWALRMISRGEAAAGKLGATAAKMISRLRPSVNPDAWSAAMIRFQHESSAGLVSRIRKATPIMLVFVAVDGLVVLLCLRFTGIPSHHIGYFAVLVAIFALYPLTIFPFAGLGILDAALIALLDAEGAVDRPDMVAALLIWRVATLAFPLIPGLFALLGWRARHGSRDNGREST